MTTATGVPLDKRTDAECKAKVMLADLGTGYRPGAPLRSVGAFQKSWNVLLPFVKGIPGVVIPSRNGGLLTVDDLYGSQSAMGAQNFVPVRIPSRASDVPTWAAQNQDALNQMCPPAPPVQPVPPPPALPPVISPAQPPSIEEAKAAPVVVLPPPPVAPPPAVQVPRPIEVKLPNAPALIPEPEVKFETPLKITTAPRRGDAPLLAIGIGTVLLGGALAAWLYKRRKRR